MIDKRSWPQYTGVKIRHDLNQIRGKGSPKSKRIANEMDEGRRKRLTCRRCESEGHNTRTLHIKVMLYYILYIKIIIINLIHIIININIM